VRSWKRRQEKKLGKCFFGKGDRKRSRERAFGKRRLKKETGKNGFDN
jgi:hypothetical protein